MVFVSGPKFETERQGTNTKTWPTPPWCRRSSPTCLWKTARSSCTILKPGKCTRFHGLASWWGIYKMTVLLQQFNAHTQKWYHYVVSREALQQPMFQRQIHEQDLSASPSMLFHRTQCMYCGTLFESRNKLFYHLGFHGVDIRRPQEMEMEGALPQRKRRNKRRWWKCRRRTQKKKVVKKEHVKDYTMEKLLAQLHMGWFLFFGCGCLVDKKFLPMSKKWRGFSSLARIPTAIMDTVLWRTTWPRNLPKRRILN